MCGTILKSIDRYDDCRGDPDGTDDIVVKLGHLRGLYARVGEDVQTWPSCSLLFSLSVRLVEEIDAIAI